MKKSKKFLSLLLAVGMILAMAVPAFAAERQTPLLPLRLLSFEEYDQLRAATTKTGTALLRRTDGMGARGVACAQFTADDDSVAFSITEAPGVSRYYAQLYLGPIGDDNVPVTDWGGSDGIQVGRSVSADDLTVGAVYHFKVSSYDGTEAGITAKWKVETYSSVSALANTDLESAPAEMRDDILAARRKIVYAPDAAWSANGSACVVHADGTTELLPKFSDLYPGWDLSEISNYDVAAPAAPENESRGEVPTLLEDEMDLYLYRTMDLRVTTEGDYTDPFLATGSNGRVRAVTLPGEAWNAEVYNFRTGDTVAYMRNMKIGDNLVFTTTPNVFYKVRVSSADTPGEALIVVTNLR